MNCSAYIFGELTDGYSQYPEDSSSNLFQNIYKMCGAPTQMIIHREGSLMYYIYVRKIDAKRYIGLAIIINGQYILEAINLFRDSEKSLRDELMHNVPFGMAVAIVEYWRKAGPDYENYASSLRGRAEMWKSVYNSRLGKGTVADYEKRCADYRKFDAEGGPERLNAKAKETRKASPVATKQPVGDIRKGKRGRS